MNKAEISESIINLVPDAIKKHPVLNLLVFSTALLVSSCANNKAQDTKAIEADLSGDTAKVEATEKAKAEQVTAIINKVIQEESAGLDTKTISSLNTTLLHSIYYKSTIDEFEQLSSDVGLKTRRNEITLQEFELQFRNIIKKLEDIDSKKIQQGDSLDLFEKTASLNISEILSKFPKLKEELLISAMNIGLEFRENDKGGLNVNYRTGLPVFAYDSAIDISAFEEELSIAISQYTEIPLTDTIRIEVDQETEIDPEVVQSTKYKERIKIFKKNVEALKKAAGKGFWFKIESFNPSDNSFKMSIFKNNFKKGEIVGSNDRWYWQDELINTINNSDEKLQKDEKTKKTDLILVKKEFNEYSDTLEDDEKKVEVVNALITAITKHNLDLEYKYIRYFLDNLPSEIQISLYEKEDIILSIYKKMHERGGKVVDDTPLLKYVIGNIESFFYTTAELIKNKNLSEKEFDNLVKQHHSFLNKFIIFMIQTEPEESLKNLDKLSDIFNQEAVLSPVSGDISGNFGMPASRVSIMEFAFKSNPDLIEKYKHLYESNPALINHMQTIKKDLSTYSSVRSYSRDKNLSAFTNSNQTPASLFLAKSISDELLEKLTPNMSERERTDIRLAISRNISYASNLDGDMALNRFRENASALITTEVNKILSTTKKIYKEPIIADRAFLHLAHYGQGKDSFGVTGEIEAIKNQQKNNTGTYQLFDGESQKGKPRIEQQKWLENFLETYIKADKPVTQLLEGHANASGFSVLLEYDRASLWELTYSGVKSLELTPKLLAKAAIKRQVYRDKYGITEPDLILFTACEGDYVTNFQSDINKLMGNKFSELVVPPAIMTAAEFGENSIFNNSPLCATTKKDDPFCKIPYEFPRECLDFLGARSTYGTFFENQYSKGMSSNPTLWYPIPRNDNGYPEWVPQNIR